MSVFATGAPCTECGKQQTFAGQFAQSRRRRDIKDREIMNFTDIAGVAVNPVQLPDQLQRLGTQFGNPPE